MTFGDEFGKRIHSLDKHSQNLYVALLQITQRSLFTVDLPWKCPHSSVGRLVQLAGLTRVPRVNCS